MSDKEKMMEENKLTQVDCISLGDCYGWTDLEIYYSEEKDRYFWLEGSGCSCNSLWDDVKTLADMCDGNRKNVADAIRRFAKDNSNSWNGEVVISSKLLAL